MRTQLEEEQWRQSLTSEYRIMMASNQRYEETNAELLPQDALMKALVWDPSQGKNLILSGPTGTGKSRIAWSVVKSLMMGQWIRCRVVAETELAIEVGDRATHGTLKEYLKPLCSSPVLMIDDMGKAPPTERFVSSLHHIADARYAAKRPLIVTTQLTHKELKEKLSSRGESDSNALSILRRLCEDALIIQIQPNKTHATNH